MENQYNVTLTSKEFIVLFKNTVENKDNILLNLLYKTAEKSPELVSELLLTQLSKTQYQGNYINFALQKKLYDWTDLLLNNDVAKKLIIKSLKAATKQADILNEDKLHGVFNHINGINYFFKMNKEILKNNVRDVEDEFFQINVNRIYQSISNILLNEAKEDRQLIKNFLEGSVERASELLDKTKYYKKPAFFVYLPMFEGVMEELDLLNIINWDKKSEENQNILHGILNYDPPIINLILANIKPSQWLEYDNANRNPIMALAHVDFKSVKELNRLEYLLNNHVINYVEEPIAFKTILKQTIKSYCNIGNTEEIDVAIMNVFSTLIQYPQIDTLEKNDSLQVLLSKNKNSIKAKHLNDIVLYENLQKLIPVKTEMKKPKIKI